MDDQQLLTEVATAVATRAAEGAAFEALTGFVRGRVGATLGAGPEEDRIAALRNALQTAALGDADLVPQLARLWRAFRVKHPGARDAVSNSNTGTVSGNLLQAGNVYGGVTFGG